MSTIGAGRGAISALLITLLAVSALLHEKVQAQGQASLLHSGRVPTLPVFPKMYTVEFLFILPYGNIMQPVRVAYDEIRNREMIDYFNGMDVNLYRYDEGKMYEIHPRFQQFECIVSPADPTSSSLVNMFPNLTSWQYVKDEFKNGFMCHRYSLVEKQGSKTNTYDFWVTVEGQRPIEYSMRYGYDVVFGSHYDEYILRFGRYFPYLAPSEEFLVPHVCQQSDSLVEHSKSRADRLGYSLRRLLPLSHEQNDPFSAFMREHGKQYFGNEYFTRRDTFLRNLNIIEKHNSRADVKHKMALNKFADLSFDEFRRMHLSIRRPGRTPVSNAHATFSRGNAAPPPSINWIEKGVVGPVRDQAACGSCWAFATTAAVESAHAIAKGSFVSLSEQSLVDCLWDSAQSRGCDGGFAEEAFDYIISKGGMPTADTYPYIGVNGFCEYDSSFWGASISKYYNVTSGSEDDLMAAVAEHGPISVAIQVLPSFVFYGSGVYYDPQCKSDRDDLDHAVVVVGYGTESDGSAYWLVRNSWSTHWGDQGYVKMARNRGNNCGIATEANFPVVN